MSPDAHGRLRRVGFRCDADSVGLGHIVRTIALADALSERGCLCWFRGDSLAQRLAVRAGYPVLGDDQAGPAFADAWVVDLQDGCPPRVAERLRPLCRALVVLNGVGYSTDDPARLLADLVYYQGCSERPHALDWTGFAGRWREGADWLVLRREFARLRRRRTLPHDPARIFVSGGGANKAALAQRLARPLVAAGYEVRAVLGVRDTQARAELEALGVETFDRPRNPAAVMAWADAAVVAYGMTALECLCLGLPTLAVSLTAGHLEGAELVERRSVGALKSLGLADRLDRTTPLPFLASALAHLDEKSRAALAFVDGLGAGRVADEIMEVLDGK